MSVFHRAGAPFFFLLFAVGCGGKESASVADLSASSSTDMAAGASCTQLSFPNDSGSLLAIETDDPSSGIDWADQLGSFVSGSSAGLLDTMFYAYWHPRGSADPSLPHAATFSTSTTLTACVDCLTIDLDATSPDDLSSGTLYLAQGGTITATALDHAATGTIAVSGTGLHFVEWQQTDKALPGGRCIDVASFAFSATYANAGDMQ